VERVAAGRELDAKERASLEADAQRRLAMQTENEAHAAECLVIRNEDGLEALEAEVDAAWAELRQPLVRQTR